jgi:hypothetical protein
MKLRYGTLRRVLHEVALSPSVFKNNKPIDDPMDKPTVAKAVATLEEPFKRAIEANLVLAAQASYDPQTREFDDSVYQQIQATATKASEAMMARVHKAIQGAWQEAMKSASGAAEQQPVPQKKVA